MPDNSIPAIAFDNQLAYDVIVYDSFDDDDDDSSSTTNSNNSQAYFATLTQLGKVPAGQTVSLQPIHDSSAFVVESATDNKPIKRMVALSFDDVTSLSIVKDDEAAMVQTFQFVNFFLNNPADPISVAFSKVLNDTTDDLATGIDDFFAAQPAYNKCSFEDYMMALAFTAQHPLVPSPSQPAGSSSLKTVSQLMGSKWPTSLSDIFVTKFSSTMQNKKLVLTFEVDINTLPFENPVIAANVRTLFTGTQMVKAQILFNYEIGLNIFGTRLSLLLDALTIPIENNKTLTIKKPTASIDINPLFKFVVFTMKGTFPFNINGKTFDAVASFVIDNDEAAIGVDIQGDKTSLPAPPGLKGLHFDEFGVGMALFFKPPGFGVGIQGKFHIGDNSANLVSLDDDSFALVCEFLEETVEPKYVAFSVPQLSLNQVVELFTNANPKIDVPVNFTDLYFHWSDGLMDAVVLPDGTLSAGGYGFSAAVDVFSFGFYGEANLDLNSGLKANVEVSPVNWKNIFKLKGDGKGFSLKYDAAGNPVPSNFVPTTQAEKDAVASATTKQVVAPGGPCLIINTLSQPILHLNAKASLFDIADCAIQADINKDGIKFELDYGAILTEKMVCNLTDFHNLYAEFGYHIDKSIPLPSMGGVNPGSIPLKTDASLHLSIKTSLTDVVISAGGRFDWGYHFTFGDFNVDNNITKITDFVGAIVQYIIDEAKSIFSLFIDTAEHWAAAAGYGILTGFDDAGKVMKNAFGKTEQEMVNILKGAGFAANDIANGLVNGYKTASQTIGSFLKTAGYDVATIGGAIQHAFNCDMNGVSWVLHEIGYGAEDVVIAIKSVFGSPAAQDVFNTLKQWGYQFSDIAKGLRDIMGTDSPHIAALLRDADCDIATIGKDVQYAFNCGMNDIIWTIQYLGGYGAEDVTKAVKAAVNATEQELTTALKKWNYTANDIATSLKDVYKTDSQHIVAFLRDAGYDVETIGSAVQHAFNCGADGIAWAMHYVGYAANDAAKAIKGAFNNIALQVEDIAGPLLKFGYIIGDIGRAVYNVITQDAQAVANAFKSLGATAADAADTVKNTFGKVISDTATILKQAGYATADVASALKNAFNTSVDAVADAMKQVGYAASDVKNAFDELGGDFKSFADTAWGDVKHYLNPSNW